MTNDMKKNIYDKFPILGIIAGIAYIIYDILNFINMLEDKEILPQKTFVIVFYFISAVFVFIIIIICLYCVLKPLYIDAQLEAFKLAKNSIYLSIHSLNPSSGNSKFVKFHELLREAKNQGIKVQIIAPCGVERVCGAFEMVYYYDMGENMRFLKQLEDEDLRYTLIDDGTAIISYQKVPSKRLSHKFACIRSKRLNSLLKIQFTSLWSDKNSLNFEQYLLNLLDELEVTKGDVSSIKRAAIRLQIPEWYLAKVLNENESFNTEV